MTTKTTYNYYRKLNKQNKKKILLVEGGEFLLDCNIYGNTFLHKFHHAGEKLY